MSHPKLEAYKEACNYPGNLDERSITDALGRYLVALGVKRKIVRLPAEWQLADFPSLEKYVDAVLKEFSARAAIDARAARAARAAIDDDKIKRRFAAWCIQSNPWSYWRFELSWITPTLFGAKTKKVRAWSEPLLDAFIAGCWMLHWTEDTLYWIAKPKVHTIDSAGRRTLHNPTGAALESDIEPLYFLNGVLMDEAHVLMPAENIDPTAVMKEENVEVRRELIRKMGVEMLLSHLPHRVMDRSGNYELLSIDFPDLMQDARYLKMLNPSIQVFHLEGVERICDTVQKAINWRAGVFGHVEWNPTQLT